MARALERIEFSPGDAGTVVARMDTLAGARDGWINVLPGVRDTDVPEPSAQGPLASLFGSNRTGMTMATWMPPSAGRRARSVESLGVMHPVGKRAAPVLREAGTPVPDGWRIVQDHNRRGLILEVPAGTPHADVLEWALQAAAKLCTEAMTGMWRADVHLPRDPR